MHYVPRLLLRGFAVGKTGDVLWRYCKDGSKPVRLTTHDAACEKHLYDLQGEALLWLDDVFTKVEGHAARPLSRLKQQECLSLSERVDLAIMLGVQAVRTPVYIQSMEAGASLVLNDVTRWLAADEKRFSATMEACRHRGLLPAGFDVRRAREAIRASDVTCPAPRASLLVGLVDVARSWARAAVSMRWSVLRAPVGVPYLCSDNPVYVEDPERDRHRSSGAALQSSRAVEMTCPLSADLALLGTWPHSTQIIHCDASPAVVKEVNRRTVYAAGKYIYAGAKSQWVTGFVKKHAECAPPSIVAAIEEVGAELWLRFTTSSHPVASIVSML
jgi:hypothetical protein